MTKKEKAAAVIKEGAATARRYDAVRRKANTKMSMIRQFLANALKLTEVPEISNRLRADLAYVSTCVERHLDYDAGAVNGSFEKALQLRPIVDAELQVALKARTDWMGECADFYKKQEADLSEFFDEITRLLKVRCDMPASTMSLLPPPPHIFVPLQCCCCCSCQEGDKQEEGAFGKVSDFPGTPYSHTVSIIHCFTRPPPSHPVASRPAELQALLDPQEAAGGPRGQPRHGGRSVLVGQGDAIFQSVVVLFVLQQQRISPVPTTPADDCVVIIIDATTASIQRHKEKQFYRECAIKRGRRCAERWPARQRRRSEQAGGVESGHERCEACKIWESRWLVG